MLPGPEPSPCPEIRLDCYLKPSSVRKGVGGGKPPSQCQTPVTLGEDKRGAERRREERSSSGSVFILMALVAKSLHCS